MRSQASCSRAWPPSVSKIACNRSLSWAVPSSPSTYSGPAGRRPRMIHSSVNVPAPLPDPSSDTGHFLDWLNGYVFHRSSRRRRLRGLRLQPRRRPQRPCRRPTPTPFAAGGRRLRRCRRRQADGPLRRPHQRLLPRTLAPPVLAVALQRRQGALGSLLPSQRPRLAGHEHTLQRPHLQQIVTRQRHAQGLRRLGRRPRARQHLENRRRQPLGRGAGARAPVRRRAAWTTLRLHCFPRRGHCCRVRHDVPCFLHGAPPSSAPNASASRRRPSSKGDVPGAGSSCSISSLLTTPAGHSGAGSDIGMSLVASAFPASLAEGPRATGGAARSISCRVPAGPVRITRSPSACRLTGRPPTCPVKYKACFGTPWRASSKALAATRAASVFFTSDAAPK